MARESEKRQKQEEYDLEMDRIKNQRLILQQDFEKNLHSTERDNSQLLEENIKRLNSLWENKLREEKKRWAMMRTEKIKKAEEGEESILLTESYPNIMEQELKVELQKLMEEINQNTTIAQ